MFLRIDRDVLERFRATGPAGNRE
ncbi:hypothetical protein [Sphingomonas sp. BE137]|nr:hypothetical protein [Sphingomonas sp. BE137]